MEEQLTKLEKQIETLARIRQPIETIQQQLNLYISGLLSEKDTPNQHYKKN